MNSFEIASAAARALFVDFDAEAAARLLKPDYIQHNPAVPTGAAPILGFLPGLKASGIKFTTHRALCEGDYVVFHNTYENATAFGAPTLVAFDVFRVEDGRVAEHWDNLQAPGAPNPSGHTMTDGAADIADRGATQANKALIAAFADAVLIRGEAERLTEFISEAGYVQHNPGVADGVDGLVKALTHLAATGSALRYSKVHRIVGEGNFVFLMSSGFFGETPTAYFDLFRVEGGKIVEHWDVISGIPDQMAHANGKF